MITADQPVQRPVDAKLLVVDADGHLRHAARRTFVDFLQAGDLVVANDAATIPASLQGTHVPTRRAIEVRLAAWHSPAAQDVAHFSAVVFGEGDYHTLTENRHCRHLWPWAIASPSVLCRPSSPACSDIPG